MIIVSFIPFKCPIIPSKFVSPKLMSKPSLNILANSFTLPIKPSNADVSLVIVLDTSNVSFIPAELPPDPPLDPPEVSVSFCSTFKLSNAAKLFDAFFASFPAFFALSPTPEIASEAVPA